MTVAAEGKNYESDENQMPFLAMTNFPGNFRVDLVRRHHDLRAVDASDNDGLDICDILDTSDDSGTLEQVLAMDR